MNNFLKNSFLLILTILYITSSYAGNVQDYSVQTPNASDLGRFGMFPVSYFSGTTNVSIPIFSANQQGVPLNIYLQYDATGVKPNRLPSWTGTSWTLMAGGVINRVKKGESDDFENSGNYFKNFNRINFSTDKVDTIKKVDEEIKSLYEKIQLNKQLKRNTKDKKELNQYSDLICKYEDTLELKKKIE